MLVGRLLGWQLNKGLPVKQMDRLNNWGMGPIRNRIARLIGTSALAVGEPVSRWNPMTLNQENQAFFSLSWGFLQGIGKKLQRRIPFVRFFRHELAGIRVHRTQEGYPNKYATIKRGIARAKSNRLMKLMSFLWTPTFVTTDIISLL